MSTHSRIGITLEDGTVASIYCHHDGYLENNGVLLVKYYYHTKAALDLIHLGDISFLGWTTEPEGEHAFDNPEEGVTCAYMRDRGESNCDYIISDESDFWNKHQEEFNYLFKNNQWYFQDGLVSETLKNIPISDNESFDIWN